MEFLACQVSPVVAAVIVAVSAVSTDPSGRTRGVPPGGLGPLRFLIPSSHFSSGCSSNCDGHAAKL